MLNDNYKKQLKVEFEGLKQLYKFLLNKNLLDVSFNDFVLHCINKGIYNNNIIDFIDNIDFENVEEEIVKPKPKNKWLNFIREYSQKHNMSFRFAMSDPKAKEEYLKLKG